MEPRLWQCILLLAENIVPGGYMLDVGANNGASTLMLAHQFTNNTVLAVEPIMSNVMEIRRRVRNLSNVQIVRGGLGRRDGNATYGAILDARPLDAMGKTGPQYGDRLKYNAGQRADTRRVKFPVYTIDKLVKSDRLSFAHIDVEGAEEDVLNGGMQTFYRDRPIFTIERFPYSRPQFYRSAMDLLTFMQYDAYEIPESCGADDCRNYVALLIEKHLTIPKQCICITCSSSE